jgi:ADP-dependent phosphofructokinase/glucokinase
MRKTGDHRIHVEFADFNGDEFFRLFEKHVVRNANSLGMNEQELLMLLEYWKDGHVAGAKNSKPSFQDILYQLKEFFEK